MKRTEVIEDGNLLARTLTVQEPRQVPGAGKIVTLRAVSAQQCRSEAFWFRKILGPDAGRQHPAHHLLHHLLHVPPGPSCTDLSCHPFPSSPIMGIMQDTTAPIRNKLAPLRTNTIVVNSRLEGSLPCIIEHSSHFVRLTLSPQQKESPF